MTLQLILVIVYVTGMTTCQKANLRVNSCKNGEPIDLSSDLSGEVIGLQIAYTILQVSALVALHLVTKRAKKETLTFHDYLIAYKQTPRSRIFKRYRPPMDAVAEVESQYEQSEMSNSASIIYSQRVSLNSAGTIVSKTSKTFRFKE